MARKLYGKLEQNLSLTDRIFRLLLAAAIIGTAAALGSWWGLVSAYFLGTAAAGWSPLYHLIGHSSCRYRGPEAICDESER
jgi:hypothetical protein